jgi:hypothetical protein
MFNLHPFGSQPEFDLYLQILTSKRDPSYMRELSVIHEEMSSQFGIFSIESRTNSLENVVSLNISNENKKKLRQLYNYKNIVIQNIKKEVTLIGRPRTVVECQYCTINSVSSMDHIMPKGKFPEFSVNAQNLFPCCLQCNNYKAEVWLEDNRRQFLNLYLDELPDEQYLFVTIIQEGIINPIFYLENRSEIADPVFELICRHYVNLHLFQRFAEASNTVVTNLRNTLISLPHQMSSAEVRTFIQAESVQQSQYFGRNYWKTVLRVALCENEEFLLTCGIS